MEEDSAWLVGGGAPDPRVEVRDAGSEVAASSNRLCWEFSSKQWASNRLGELNFNSVSCAIRNSIRGGFCPICKRGFGVRR